MSITDTNTITQLADLATHPSSWITWGKAATTLFFASEALTITKSTRTKGVLLLALRLMAIIGHYSGKLYERITSHPALSPSPNSHESLTTAFQDVDQAVKEYHTSKPNSEGPSK